MTDSDSQTSERSNRNQLGRISGGVDRRSYLKTTGIAIGSIGFAGCISDLGAGGTNGSESVDIGISVSLSGNFSVSGQKLADGYKLWEEHINEDGGILGKDVNLHIEDDESKEEQAVSNANRLIEQQNVDVFLGPYSSPITAAMMPVMKSNEIPMLATIASDPGLFDGSNEWVFQAFPDSHTDHEYAVELAGEKNVETAALLWESIDFAQASRDGAVSFCEDAGIEIRDWEISYGTTDVSTPMTEIADYGPDLVLGSVYGETLISMTREMINRNFNPKQFSALIVTNDSFVEAIGDQVQGTMGRAPWSPVLQGDMHERFANDFESKFNYTPDYHSATSYSGGQVYATAAEEAGSNDPTEIRDFFANQTAETLCGTYEVNDDFNQAGYYNRLIQWQGDRQEIIKPEEDTTTDSIIWPKPGW